MGVFLVELYVFSMCVTMGMLLVELDVFTMQKHQKNSVKGSNWKDLRVKKCHTV